MSQTLLEQSLGQLACDIPGATRIFHTFKLDFCCGGHKSLREAALGKDLDPVLIADALHRSARRRRNPARLAQRTVGTVDRPPSGALPRPPPRATAGTDPPGPPRRAGPWCAQQLPQRPGRSADRHATRTRRPHAQGRTSAVPDAATGHRSSGRAADPGAALRT